MHESEVEGEEASIAKRRGTAYHEAGHAVIGRLIGVELISISVKADSGANSGGRCQWQPHHEFEHAIICLASDVARWAFEGEVGAGSYEDSAEYDLDMLQFVEVLAPLFREDGEGLEHVRTALIALLSAAMRSPEVDRDVKLLARELMRREFLTGPEVEEVLAAS